METQENTNRLESNLEHFTGTEAYHKLTLYKRVLFTDGVAYLAKEAKCYWLCDLIAGFFASKQVEDYFCSIEITISDKSTGTVRITDGNTKTLFKKHVGYTDFPLREFKLFAGLSECGGREVWVVMLPSEY